jgi:ATP-dependent Clp protease ATP-binding subunit ClpC
MSDRFSTQARQTVEAAREQARLLAHSYVGTEHLLLGLLAQGEGTARTALQMLAVDTESIRDQALALAGTAPGPGPRSRAGQVRFTLGARKVLERSLAEALKAGHKFIGAEHMLLALLRDEDGIAGRILAAHGADLTAARGFVAGLVEESGLPPGVVIEPRQPRARRRLGRRRDG